MRTYTVLACIAVSLVVAGLASGCNNYRNLRRTSQGIVNISHLPPQPAPSAITPPPTAWTVDIHSARGAIDIQVDPTIARPTIWVNVPELKDRTDPATWVAAEAIVDESSHVLQVSAAPPETLGYSVYLTITLPASDGVKIRSAGGAVDLRGVGGAIDIESGGGMGTGSPITLKTKAVLTKGVRAITSAGDVRIYCGKGSTGVLAVQGSTVSVTPAAGEVVHNAKQNGQAFAAKVGSGEAPFEVRSQQGSVDVRLNN